MNKEQVTPSDPNAVVIEVDENASVAVLITKQRRNSLMACTKRCLGLRVDSARCLNRRRPGRDNQVWCHHHLSQKELFDALRKGETVEASEWWL